MTDQPTDVTLLQAASESTAALDQRYREAYAAYTHAFELFMNSLISLVRTGATDEAIKLSQQTLATVLVMRKIMDDAQSARIAAASTYHQIVRLLAEEIIEVLRSHETRLHELTILLAKLPEE